MVFAIALKLFAQVPSKINAQLRDSLAKSPPFFLETAKKALKWEEPVEPVKIAGPIYYVGTKGLASYLITTPKGHILLYTGMPSSGPMIEASIRKLGFKPEDIKIMLTGHAHIDHVGGHAYLQKLSGAQVVMMEQEKELIESGGKTDFHYGSYSQFLFDPVKVNRVIADGDVVKLGNIELTGRLTPGHTMGSTTWIMKIVVSGRTYKVVFPDGTSINPGYRLVNNPSYSGIADNYRKTFKILASLNPDIWLTSHAEAFNFAGKSMRAVKEGVNAWVDPPGYQIYVANQRKKFEDQVNKEMQQ